MKQLAIMLSVLVLALLPSVHALLTLNTQWETSQDTAAINYGQSINFGVSAQTTGSSFPYVQAVLFDKDYAPLHTYINAAQGTNTYQNSFSVAPAQYQRAGIYHVKFEAKDSLGETQYKFIDLTVNKLQPVLITPIPAQATPEGTPLTIDMASYFTDPEPADVLAYQVTTKYSQTDLQVSVSGSQVTFTPANPEWAGQHTFTAIASDGMFSVPSNPFTVTVTPVNDAPRIASFAPVSLNPAINEGDTLAFSVTATDPDNAVLGYLWTLDSQPVSSTTAYNYVTGFTDAGTHIVKVVVSDGQLSDSKTWNVTVNNVNRAPVLAAIGSKQVAENALLQFTISATDADNDALLYTTSPLPQGAAFQNRQFSWIPSFQQSGSYQVTFIVNDGNGGTDSETVTLTVTDVNRAPVLAIADKTGRENELLQFTITATDQDNDSLAYTASNLPQGASFQNRQFSWTPTFQQSGSYSVTFTVSDGKGGADSKTIIITVSNVNRAPVLAAIGDKQARESEPLQFAVSAADPDGNGLTYTATSLPEGASFQSRQFSWIPTFQQSGSHQVTFSVSDGELSDSEAITITVGDVNRAPVFVSLTNKQGKENELLQFTVSAADPDNDTLTYNATGLPQGASFQGQQFSWTPTFQQAGSYQVTFSVSDGKETVSQGITIAVGDVNRAPVLASIGDKQAAENELLQFTVSATDQDNDTLTYSANGLPQGAAFQNRQFSWTPTFQQAGSYPVTFTVSDGSLTDSETITIRIGNANRAPVITSTPLTSFRTNQRFDLTYTYDVEATDPDGDQLAYSLRQGPEGMTISTSTGLIQWTPNENQLGTVFVQVQVSDGALIAFQGFSITVSTTPSAILPREKIYIGSAGFLDERVQPGEATSAYVTFTNTDNLEMEHARVTVSIPELAVRSRAGPFALNTGDKVTKTLPLEIPADASGEYLARFTISDGKVKRTIYRPMEVR
ncbi:tandem-95 repeat protein [Candidatus Woesearchaeota archaeon]|nr:tandem-95 repeat protein [Candidatus Woesearchaeota archaeon]